MTEIRDLISVLSRLPGIGKKTGMRLSYFLLKNKELSIEIANTIINVINEVSYCSVCNNFSTTQICPICSDQTRDKTILCVIEESKDLIAIEETNTYKGQYHILMGNINPLEGINPEKLKIKELIDRVKKECFSEVLIATNPTIEGEVTFLYISKLLTEFNIKKSRIATGIPMGGSLEYSDKLTLGKSIQSKYYL